MSQITLQQWLENINDKRLSDLHQSDHLSRVYTFLVDENQNANDGTDEAEAPHEAGYDQRRVHRHRHQLAAALSVVVPVFTHRASEDMRRNMCCKVRERKDFHFDFQTKKKHQEMYKITTCAFWKIE